MNIKSKKSWRQKRARCDARNKDNPRKIYFQGKNWDKKGERRYIIFDEKNDRYICAKGSDRNERELKFGGYSCFTTKDQNKARWDYASGGPINYILNKIKTTGAWRVIRVK